MSKPPPPKRPLRPAMAGVHTWAGVLLGWLLYFMFVTGTAGYLDTEIDRWMRPELPAASYPLPPEPQAAHALAYLQAHAPDARSWSIQLPVDRNEPYLRVEWSPPNPALPQPVWLDAQTGAPIAVRDTAGGQALYQLHWRLHYLPPALTEWVIAIASMVLLLALLTGIVAHRRFFADFFTLRLGKGQRSWLDAHNLASVASLPFQLMISYSGLVFVMFSFMPLIASAWYGQAPGAAVRSFYGELFPPMAAAPASGQPAPLTAIAPLLVQAQARWQGAPVAVLTVQNPGDANARISAIGNFAAGPVREAGILVFDGVSGALLAERPARQSTPRAARDLWLGLHEGLFAGAVLRALYLLSGLLGCVMIATGMVLWSVKRQARQPSAGHALVSRLNPAAILGLPVAIAAYLWANRLLPSGMEGRAQWELHALFAVWLAGFAYAACTVPAKAWRWLAWCAALGFGLLPLLNAATSDRHLFQSLATGDAVMAVMDLGFLALGLAFAGCAVAIQRRQRMLR
ncbi:PepSY-associated TM helix domain-containing protein [Comamonas piscis]|uniref:PepSY-associated TM helix domain-containing protein n=1 Tax=Comamonas piscis TaxID=1562974 RepID=UPI001EE2EAAE|nr:PepSY-associated TM helix domain-containing protein [Comamonas piscis]WSO34630.1 PepSY-associated TM helix domain-containing protein [Comamonas piscis]